MATAAVAKAVSAGPLDQWKPNTPKQAKTKAILQGAFVEAPKTNIVVANNRAADNTPLPGTTEVYTLKSRGYFDLKAYVLSGIMFPQTPEEFDRKLPKAHMKKLTDVDSEIYNFTEITFIRLGQSCTEFNRDSLGSFITTANSNIAFCNGAVRKLTNFGSNDIRDQFQILMDPKYAVLANQDDTFTQALSRAKVLLGSLSNETANQALAMDAHIEKLNAFQEITAELKPRMDFIKKQWITGDVVEGTMGSTKLKYDKQTPPQKFKPYSVFLNAELAQLQKDIIRLNQEVDDSYDNWQHYTTVAATAVTYMWTIAGPIVMGVYTSYAVAERKKYNDLKDQVSAAGIEKASLIRITEEVNGMVKMFDGFLLKLTKALEAMTVIKQNFLQQSGAFKEAADMMRMTDGMVDGKIHEYGTMVDDAIVMGSDNYKKVAKLAQEFIDSAIVIKPM